MTVQQRRDQEEPDRGDQGDQRDLQEQGLSREPHRAVGHPPTLRREQNAQNVLNAAYAGNIDKSRQRDVAHLRFPGTQRSCK
ncbi:hypothetical protein GCM10027597_21140 [Saccharopolyspora tripterygii]